MPDICIVLFTYFSIKFGGNSRRIDDNNHDDDHDGAADVTGGRGVRKGDIGMHKIYRLKLSQRLEAFKNDMSERLRCRKGVPPPTPPLSVVIIIIIIIILCVVGSAS